MLNLLGHTVVGVGYDDATSPPTVYLHDTWDTSVHSMTWGGTYSYSGMVLKSVSIVRLRTCDLNGDGHVDLKDTARLARAFGTTSADPLFKTAYDLNGDGTIDEQDATILFNALD